jgi:hypothetical protein
MNIRRLAVAAFAAIRLIAQTPGVPQAQRAGKAPLSPPKVMRVCANPNDWSVCSTWTWANGHYDGWREWGAMAAMTVESFSPESVVINRADAGAPGASHPGAGFRMVYRGTISGESILDGTSVDNNGGTGAFRAYWGSALQNLPLAKNPANQPRPQFQLTWQTLAQIGLLLGGGENTQGNTRARVASLESQVLQAEHDCHALGPGGSHASADKCDHYEDLKSALRRAQADYDDETEELVAAQKQLSAECKSGKKQSCQTLDQVNRELERR